MADAKSSKPKAVDLGPTIVLDEERCVLCLRCVRFDDMITGERSRAPRTAARTTIIATATGEPYHSRFQRQRHRAVPGRRPDLEDLSLQIAPVGQHRTQRPARSAAVGCQMHVDVRVRPLQRTMSVPEDDRDLRRLAVRPRPVQRRLSARRTPADAAALSQERRVGRRSAGTTRSTLWAGALRAAIASTGRRFGRRDRRRPAAQRRSVLAAARPPRAGRRESRLAQRAVSIAPIPATPAARTSISSMRRHHQLRTVGRPAGAGARSAHSQGGRAQRRDADRGRRSDGFRRRCPACARRRSPMR